MDEARFDAEVEAAYGFLWELWKSEVRFYGTEYPEQDHDGGTPTAADILEGLANTIVNYLDNDLDGEAFRADLSRAADAEYARITEGA